MNKDGIHAGQTVWVLLMGNAAYRVKSKEPQIEEWEVEKIGRQYVYANKKGCVWKNARFNIKEGYEQDTIWTHDYKLFLSKEAAWNWIQRKRFGKYISSFIRDKFNLCFNEMADEDITIIAGILKKYDSEGGDLSAG